MSLLLAFVVVAVTLLLARRRFLHPGDYLLEAALALLLAMFVAVISPSSSQHAGLVAGGAPDTSVLGSAFLLANGKWIELASTIIALGALAAAAIRGKAFGGWPHPVGRG